MDCPKCTSINIKVKDSYNPDKSLANKRKHFFKKVFLETNLINLVWRKRECKDCGHKFNTVELITSDIEKLFTKLINI